MTVLLAYAVVLLLSVLVSALAHWTVLSAAVLFLVAGLVLGDDVTGVLNLQPQGEDDVTGVLNLQPQDEIVAILAELALFAVLFSEACESGGAISSRPGICPVGRLVGDCR